MYILCVRIAREMCKQACFIDTQYLRKGFSKFNFMRKYWHLQMPYKHLVYLNNEFIHTYIHTSSILFSFFIYSFHCFLSTFCLVSPKNASVQETVDMQKKKQKTKNAETGKSLRKKSCQSAKDRKVLKNNTQKILI